MFIRKYVHRKSDGSSDVYLAIAHTFREGEKVCQKEVCRLGRLDQLQESGQLDRLIEGLVRFSKRQWVVADEITPTPD